MNFRNMMHFTLQCGSDSQTYPLYVNGLWIVNITLSTPPVMYKYDNLMISQAEFYTVYIR